MKLPDYNWAHVRQQIDTHGFGLLPGLLDPHSCLSLRQMYEDTALFRSRIQMERYHFGRGEYQYFDYPLPPLVQTLREQLYPQLAPIANLWAEQLNMPGRFPADLASFHEAGRAAGQTRPTPLLLRYRSGDYNCLHQDIYGELHFPLQLIVALSQPDADFSGGELVLIEQRPRQQSRPRVIALQQGDAAVITVRERPEKGLRGYRRLQLRHGVSAVHGGERFTLGIIFHDAR